MLDVAVLVAVQPLPGSWVDPAIRATFAPTQLVTIRARDRVSEMLGALPETHSPSPSRTLTSVVLATSLERAGLTWRVLDLAAVHLDEWRKHLEQLRKDPPRVIAISSTFVVDGYWLGNLCELVRRTLPEARIVVGGYAYATDTKHFLSLDADVFCVGEGEQRISQIVQAFRRAADLDTIPGLYIRERGGRLRYTGNAEPIPIDALPLPDWTLSERIEPPMNPSRDPNEYCVETQRGCVFRCEFCTYRTIAAPEQSSVERAVRAIRDHRGRHGKIFLIDATATTPRDRWIRILQRLIEEGGAPLPTAVYARVSDLDDEMCSLMAQAGITTVHVGQESGDQRILNAMKKGTRIDQIAPAIAALGRHGVTAHFFIMFGFPGETPDSIASTRRMLRSLNAGHERRPVVRTVGLNVFQIQNFAAVGQNEALRGKRRFSYDDLQISASRAAEVAVETSLELSRIPYAPVIASRWGGELWSLWDDRIASRDSLAFFRWAKGIDRAVGLLVEEELGEKKADGRELGRLRREILAGVAQEHLRPGPLKRAMHRARNRAIWKLLEVWARGETETDLLTRGVMGFQVGRATGSFRDVVTAIRTGRYPELGTLREEEPAIRGFAAERIVEFGIQTGRRRLRRVS